MPAINADTAGAWQSIADSLAPQRPTVGKTVRVTSGKRKGVVGIVERHQQSRYARDAYRYGSEASHHMRDMAGRYGWCVLVRVDSRETFWCAADKVEVIPPKVEVE